MARSLFRNPNKKRNPKKKDILLEAQISTVSSKAKNGNLENKDLATLGKLLFREYRALPWYTQIFNGTFLLILSPFLLAVFAILYWRYMLHSNRVTNPNIESSRDAVNRANEANRKAETEFVQGTSEAAQKQPKSGQDLAAELDKETESR